MKTNNKKRRKSKGKKTWAHEPKMLGSLNKKLLYVGLKQPTHPGLFNFLGITTCFLSLNIFFYKIAT